MTLVLSAANLQIDLSTLKYRADSAYSSEMVVGAIICIKKFSLTFCRI